MISDNVKSIRSHFGMTQEEFADKLGVSRSVIANLECNRLQSPETKMPLFRLLSERFLVPLDWILSDDPGPLPLAEMNESNELAKKAGEMADDDPVVKSFLEFWAQRTDKEREQITKAIEDFYEILQKNKEK